MTAQGIRPRIARYVLEQSDDRDVDRVEFGNPDQNGWIAATLVDDHDGVLYYTNGVDLIQAWQGNAKEIKERAEEQIDLVVEDYRRSNETLDLHYEWSTDPMFEKIQAWDGDGITHESVEGQ